MTLGAQQRIFTRHIGCLIEYAYSIGIELTLGEAHRTRSQALLYYFGYEVREGGLLGIHLQKALKKSWTLNSLHQDRLATDFNFFINGNLTYKYEDIKPLGDYWVSLDPLNRWGGDFKKRGRKPDPGETLDIPHFERQKQ